METRKLNRRDFIKGSAILMGSSTINFNAFGQTILATRSEWQSFKATAHYDSLIKAISLMKSNTNSNDPSSWSYWTNIHRNNCPHSVPYFLAWHRGYLYYFERQLRAVSGDSLLTLPYWDYYSYSTLPVEFTNSSANNPLYVDRVNTDVRQALTLAPFSANLTNFQTGARDAYEPSFESAPHNQLHNLVGNVMATMSSPVDPIFWLHHANVDRLWVAWVNAGGGRKMPAITKPYWSGKHVYNSAVTLARTQTYNTRSTLGYQYTNERLPGQLPVAQVNKANVLRVQATSDVLPGSIPSLGSFEISAPRQIAEKTFSISGALNVGLDQRSISVQLPISAEYGRALATIAIGKPASVPGSTKLYRSAHIVLNDIEMSDMGKKGGYFYQILINRPVSKKPSGSRASILIGTLGAFEVSAGNHHAQSRVQLRYPVKHFLAGTPLSDIGMISVSFIRVSGDNTPDGAVMGIGEVRLEVSSDSD
jgi:tyrosinase